MTIAGASTDTVTRRASAQSGTPNAQRISVDAVMALSARFVGGGTLDPVHGQHLLALLSEDPARLAGLRALLDPFAADIPVAQLPDGARQVVTDILTFWYLGLIDDRPVDNREARFFSLVSWQALPYPTIPTVCKGFGSWAEDPERTGA